MNTKDEGREAAWAEWADEVAEMQHVAEAMFDAGYEHARRDEAEAVREFMTAVCLRCASRNLSFMTAARQVFNERYGEEVSDG